MIDFTVVVRESGKLKPDYSLDFQAPHLPREGDYLSIQRPDKPEPFGEDLIVRKVWWRLDHPETAGFSQDQRKGSLREIFVECEGAIGPYSSDDWRKYMQAQGAPELDVDRIAFRESELKG